MRGVALGLAWLALSVSGLWASAGKSVTVAALEQKLAANHGKPDADVAQQLLAVELTERLSAATLARLEATAPGPKAVEALKILAEESAFLPLPAAEIPQKPTPQFAEQRRMMGLVVTYVGKTIHQLPNFSATRVTTQLEDTPQIAEGTFTIPYQPMHAVRTAEEAVYYRDGQEVVGAPSAKAAAAKEPAHGLSEWGVFGPILSTVFVDAAKSSLSWGHWEQGSSGLIAVFQYAVPLANSHYKATYCCLEGGAAFDRLVGYHGEITIDPASGAIVRLTVVAELKPSDPVSVADILVEYGPVEIGGKTYICATRSVALSSAIVPSRFGPDWKQAEQVTPAEPGPPQRHLSEVSFERYHLFRAESRIITADIASDEPAPPAASGSSALPPTPPASAAEPPVATTRGEQAPLAAAPPAPEPPAAGPSLAAAAPGPMLEPASAPLDQLSVLKVTTRQVIVDVVATKGDGQPLLGLAKQDFTVKEDGVPQNLDFFEAHTLGSEAASPPPEMPPLPPGARTNVPPAQPGDAINVLLIDTLNTEVQDQAAVRREVAAFLTKMPPGSRLAIFVLSAELRCLQGFTSDPAVLLASLSGLKAEKSPLNQTRGDQDSYAENVAMMQAMQTSQSAIDALTGALGSAAARDGGARASMTYEALTYLGHYLAGVPGRKNLIWFSGSFPVTIFPSSESLARLKKTASAQASFERVTKTADLFTVAQVSVYPVSAEGVAPDHAGDAGIAGPDAGGIGHQGGGGNSAFGAYRAEADARASTIAGMEQLAASTGGKAFYNTNDLSEGLRAAVADGSSYYTLSYSPANKQMDGSFRRVEVTLAHGRSKLAYRHGYFAVDSTTPTSTIGVDPLRPLLRIGLPAATGILYGVTVKPSAKQPAPGAGPAGQNLRVGSALTRYTASFVIRAQDLSLQSNAEGLRTGRFLLGLKAFDANGKPVNWDAQEETVELKPEQFEDIRQKGIEEQVELDLPSTGAMRLVTAVYDMNGGLAGTLEVPLIDRKQ